MSWTDLQSIRVIKSLRDKFNVNTFIETGTFKGINAQLHSKNFKEIYTCEIEQRYIKAARLRCKKLTNIYFALKSSVDFLEDIVFMWGKRKEIPIIYLDAHFYDTKLPKGRGKFVILDELKALKGFKNCVIVIHDFDNNLGHIVYDNISLDLELIKEDLFKVNPKFYLYTNELSSCDIIKPSRKLLKKLGMPIDNCVFGNLKYAWKEPRLAYRGLLYCLPQKLTDKELKELGLRKWN